ncbi:transposase [Desulfacinum hydrothermale]|nr:transposase [Desulfacinum hydrothermale]
MISHADVVKTTLGLLCLGKNDFEAAAGISCDDGFQEALDIQKVPSQETMRQRLDKQANVFERLASASSVELLERTQVPVTALSTEHVPLDVEVFCRNHSDTNKEGLSRTYQDYEGYTPVGAILGQEEWCVGLELRPGSQHSQSGFVDFLHKMLRHARKVTPEPLLVRTDPAHDALETLVELRPHPKVNFIIRWNPRRADILSWRDRTFREGRVREPRAGKKVASLSTWVTRHYEERTYRFRLLIRVTERIWDGKGQILIRPFIKLEGWWTSLSVPEDEVIRLYDNTAKTGSWPFFRHSNRDN